MSFVFPRTQKPLTKTLQFGKLATERAVSATLSDLERRSTDFNSVESFKDVKQSLLQMQGRSHDLCSSLSGALASCPL